MQALSPRWVRSRTKPSPSRSSSGPLWWPTTGLDALASVTRTDAVPDTGTGDERGVSESDGGSDPAGRPGSAATPAAQARTDLTDAVPEGGAAVPEGRAAVPEGGAAVPEGGAAVPEGRAAAPGPGSESGTSPGLDRAAEPDRGLKPGPDTKPGRGPEPNRAAAGGRGATTSAPPPKTRRDPTSHPAESSRAPGQAQAGQVQAGQARTGRARTALRPAGIRVRHPARTRQQTAGARPQAPPTPGPGRAPRPRGPGRKTPSADHAETPDRADQAESTAAPHGGRTGSPGQSWDRGSERRPAAPGPAGRSASGPGQRAAAPRDRAGPPGSRRDRNLPG